MRMTQFIGLNKWATEFVHGDPVVVAVEHITRIYTDGRQEVFTREITERSVVAEPIQDFWFGMFEEEKEPLVKYTFPNGKGVYVEFVQTQPWSSGPMIFLALRYVSGDCVVEESLWTDEEIAKH